MIAVFFFQNLLFFVVCSDLLVLFHLFFMPVAAAFAPLISRFPFFHVFFWFVSLGSVVLLSFFNQIFVDVVWGLKTMNRLWSLQEGTSKPLKRLSTGVRCYEEIRNSM